MSTTQRPAQPSPAEFVPRRLTLTIPFAVGRALVDSAAANQRPAKRELLRLVIDQLKSERRLPQEYVP